MTTISYVPGLSQTFIDQLNENFLAIDTRLDLSSFASIRVEATSPTFYLKDTDNTANSRTWRQQVVGSQFAFQVGDDAESSFASWLTATRSANVITSFALAATEIAFTGLVGVGVSGGVDSPLQVQGISASPSLTADNNIFKISCSSTQELAFGGYTSGAFGIWVQGKKSTNDGTTWPIILQPLGGRVGIATVSPSSIFHVVGSSTFSGNVAQTSGATFPIGTAGGTADALTFTPTIALTEYTTGAFYIGVGNASNATTTPTANISGLGARTIVKRASTALAAADIVAGKPLLFYVSSTQLILLNPAAV